MELEKYIKVVREAINTGYYDVQDALMNRDESLKRLKNNDATCKHYFISFL